MDTPQDAQPQPPQEDVPVPVPVIRQPEYRPLNEPRIQRDESENIELMHRKLNRILGRTDEIQSIKNRIDSISKSANPAKKGKIDVPLKTHSKSVKKTRPHEGLLHIVEQRTIEMKDILDRTIDGLEQVYHQQRTVLNELREQADFLQGLAAQPPRSASPPPGPSGAEGQYQRRRCAFCDDDHHACDCRAYKTLGERKLRAFERNRCER
ncbi:hypothetical protein V3C99_003532 [Haemonchus contortus]